MASGNSHVGGRGIHKGVEKAVEIHVSQSIETDLKHKHKPKASTDLQSKSWYTPTPSLPQRGRSTVGPNSKPLPKLPDSGPALSIRSASTGSAYSSDYEPFSYDNARMQFSSPPSIVQKISSASVVKALPAIPDTFAVETPKLKVVPSPKPTVVVQRSPHTSCTLGQDPDSIVIYPTTSRRSSSLSSIDRRNSVTSIEAPSPPHPHPNTEVPENVRRRKQRIYGKEELEGKMEQWGKGFGVEFGFDSYEGQKSYERQAVTGGFGSIKPEKQWTWF